MATTRHIATLLVLLVMTAPLAAAEKTTADAPSKELSNTRIAGCLVKITGESSVLPVTLETIEALLLSSGVAGKAGRDVLGVPMQQAQQFIKVKPLAAADRMTTASPEVMPLKTAPTTMSRYGTRGSPPTLGASTKRMDDYEMAPGADRTAEDYSYYYAPRRQTTLATRPDQAAAPSPAMQSLLFGLEVVVPDLAAEPTGDFVSTLVENKPAAEEFLLALVENLRGSWHDAYRSEINRRQQLFELADRQVQEAEQQLVEYQAKLRALSKGRLLSRNTILQDIEKLRILIDDRQLEQESERAFEQAIEQRVADAQDELDAQLAEDTITKELENVIRMNLEAINSAEKLVKTGRLSTTDLIALQEKLARARIELAQRKEELSKTAAGQTASRYSKQLADMTIQKARDQAQLNMYERRLAETQALLEDADEYEVLSVKADIAKQNLQTTIFQLKEMERRNQRLQEPQITLIGI